MNLSDQHVQHYQAEFNRINQGVSDTSWLKTARQQAFTKFLQSGFPTIKQEDWKYTSVAAIEKRLFSHYTHRQAEEMTLADTDIQPYLFDEAALRLVFCNGQLISELSSVEELSSNVICNRLALAMRHDDASPSNQNLKQYLSMLSNKINHGFADLNTAFMTDGIYLHIPRNKRLEKPIHLVYVTHDVGGMRAYHPRTLIIAEENSEATIIESFIGLSQADYLINAMTEIIQHPHSQVTHCKVQQEGQNAFHIGTVSVSQAKDSHFSSHSFAFGGSLVRSDTRVELAATGAFCRLNGLYLVYGRQHVDHHTRVEHAAAYTSSHEFYKGIMADRGRGVFDGQVYVHPNACKSDASQVNKNLLLSSMAEIDTKPQLEIYNDDIKCSHGATVGQLDEQAIFLLRARGIGHEETLALLQYAFANEIVQLVENTNLQRYLSDQVIKHLEQSVSPGSLQKGLL